MGSFNERITRHVWQRIPAIDRKGAIEDTVFLAGTGRSGTTWLSNRINQRNDFRYMFEPFEPDYTPEAKAFGSRLYLAREASRPELIQPAKKILSGNIQGSWTNRYNRKLFVKKRLIKDIRTNLMLGWLRVQFPAMPMIFLLRHPLAVAASKRKLGWHGTVEIFLAQKELMKSHLVEFQDDMIQAEEDLFSIEALVWMWVIENLVPLRELRQGEAMVMYYEDFVLKPQESLRQLFDYLHMPFHEDLIKNHSKPSQTTRSDSAVRKAPQDMLKSWQKHISTQEIDQTLAILEKTGLNKIYSDNILPVSPSGSLLDLF